MRTKERKEEKTLIINWLNNFMDKMAYFIEYLDSKIDLFISLVKYKIFYFFYEAAIRVIILEEKNKKDKFKKFIFDNYILKKN